MLMGLWRLQAIRIKRSSATRDALPDEAFMRLRGSLFFGPAFLVTRNKLTFRDNLQELLASSSPGAPQFSLDQTILFKHLLFINSHSSIKLDRM